MVKEKGEGKYKKKSKTNNKKGVKSQPGVNEEEKQSSLEFENFENKIDTQLNDYIKDCSPYGFYNLY